ncbi:MAG TPA: hypothetical protein VMX17_15450 [Candidatus Glassbacteria bacterium]|nr:hypothetical protein [Candidatus Glassbacteria bacterium]
MNHGLGIEIEVQLHQKGPEELPYAVFRKILDSLNNSVFESEKNELDAIQKEFPDLPDVAFDAAKYRLKQYRYSAILIKELRPGSLIVAGCAAGVAIWVLQQTLGETLKEAWIDGQWHQKIKNILLKRMGDKRYSLATDAAKRIERAIPSETSIGNNGPVDVELLEKPSRIRIDVRIEINPKDYPPDRKNLF